MVLQSDDKDCKNILSILKIIAIKLFDIKRAG